MLSFTARPDNISINLTCMAEGHPTLTYEWYKDGELLLGETQSILHISEPSPIVIGESIPVKPSVTRNQTNLNQLD